VRSKARIMGHPLHPILIVFPIAFGAGSLGFDLDGVLANGTIACPWHGSQFDVKTGDVEAGPATGRSARTRSRRPATT
jgi:hypothetical protein